MQPTNRRRRTDTPAPTDPHKRRSTRTDAWRGRLVIAIAMASTPTMAAATPPPRYDHVVVVVMENHSYNEIIGAVAAPYINALAAQGANFTHSFAIDHPSQPNYLELFSGASQGVTNDNCPENFTGVANLGSQLIGAGLTFAGYSEDLPATGSTACSAASGRYARKHNPWVDFDNVPTTSNQPFSAFPADFATLPTLSFVIPNQCDDMHGISPICNVNVIAAGDFWLQIHLDAYAQWAKTHDSLLIVTFDEDDGSQGNQIATIFVGSRVIPGNYGDTINHYSVLATLQSIYGLAPPLGAAANNAAIGNVWDTRLFRDGFE
jgi:hypothetical protein